MSNASPSSSDLTVVRCSRPINKRSVSVSEKTSKTPASGKPGTKRRNSESESVDREVNKRQKMNVQEQKIAESVKAGLKESLENTLKEGMKEMMTSVIRKEFTELLDKRLEKMETEVQTMGERMD